MSGSEESKRSSDGPWARVAARLTRGWAAHAILLVLPTLVFWSALDNALHLDDWYRIADNPGVEEFWPPWRHFTDPTTSATLPRLAQYRPLLPLSFSISHALTGASTVGYRAGNLAVHLASVVLLFHLVRTLLSGSGSNGNGLAGARNAAGIALATALLYAVHPVSGVPVNYLCARDLLLMQAFLLAALLAYARMRRGPDTVLGWVLALGAMALSILSKTNTVALPLVIVAYELLLGERRPFGTKTWLRAAPFAAVAAGFFLVTRLIGFSDVAQLDLAKKGIAPYVSYGATQLGLHATHYLRNVAWPFFMRPLPDVTPVESALDWRLWLGVAVVAGSLAVAWRFRREQPVLSFAILAYWLLFTPTSSVLAFRYLATDYRAYPSLPWLFLAGSCAVAIGSVRWGGPRARLAVFGIALAWSIATSLWQNRVWHSEESLWEQSVRHGATPMAHVNYARAVEYRDWKLTKQHYEEALRRAPHNVVAGINLGLLEMRHGDTAGGLERVQRMADSVPRWPDAQYWLAVALQMAGKEEEAATPAFKAVQLEPRNEERRQYAITTLFRAAQLANGRNDLQAAATHLTALHHLTPHHESSRFLEGWVYHQAARLDLAAASYEKHLEAEPEHVQAYFNLAFAYMQLERHADAVTAFEKTLALDPSYREVHLHLAKCLDALGHADRAAEHRAQYGQ